MIRGILLLILSCVVLTLQTCTCEQNAQPTVPASAAYFYPVSSAEGYDFTQRPDAGIGELLTRCTKLNSKTLLKDTTTAQFQTIETEGKSFLDTLTVEITRLTTLKAKVAQECGLVTEGINEDCRSMDQLVSTIYDPLPAIDHCTRSLYILSRQKYCNRLVLHLDLTLKAKLSLKILWETYVKLLGTAISLAKTIDNLLGLCLGLLCNRGGIVQTLTTPLVQTLAAGTAGIVSSISSLKLSVDADIAANIDVFALISVTDQNCNLYRDHLFGNWGMQERLDCPTWEDIGSICSELTHNPAPIHTLIDPQLYGYTLSPNRNFICYSDASSITCSYTTKISLLTILNVQLDVNVAALKLAHVCRVVMLALTGSYYVEAKPLSVAVDGTVVIQITIDRECHDLIRTVYQNPDIVRSCGIDSVVHQVSGAVLTIIEEHLPIDVLKSQLQSAISNAAAGYDQVIRNLGTTRDVQTTLGNDLAGAIVSLGITEVIPDIARLAYDRCIAYKTGELDVLRTVLSIVERAKITVLAKVTFCRTALVQAEIDLNANPNNQLYSARYGQLHQAYMNSLKAATQIQVQVNLLCDTLKAKIEVNALGLTTLTDALLVNLDGIVKTVVKLIPALRVEIQVKLDIFITRITDCIRAFIPSCGIINIDFLNLSVLEDTFIKVSVCINDPPLPGVLLEDRRHHHHSTIRAAIILGIGCSNVEVVDIIVSESDHYCYEAIIR